MNYLTKSYPMFALIDFMGTFVIYALTNGTSFVYASVIPTAILIPLLIMLKKAVNEIYKTIDKQDGKCYNCNLKIIDKDTASLETNNHVYCEDCHEKLFGDKYVNRGGVSYRK